jgi:hypothetical protein
MPRGAGLRAMSLPNGTQGINDFIVMQRGYSFLFGESIGFYEKFT